MSEEEIIKTLQVLIGLEEFNKLSYKENKAIQGLLDLYTKQQKEIEEKNVAINKMSKDISRQLKEIEKLNFENHIVKKWNKQLDKNCISKDKIKEIRDKAEVMDYYSLNDVIDDLSKLIGDYEEDDE